VLCVSTSPLANTSISIVAFGAVRRPKEIVISNWPPADRYPVRCGAEQAYSLRLEYAPAAADTPVPDIQADGTRARLCFHANHAVTLNRIQGG
jgi:hypothetical protein